jgi:hypothetical protein
MCVYLGRKQEPDGGWGIRTGPLQAIKQLLDEEK